MMDLYRVTFAGGGEYGVTLWGFTPDDLDPFLEPLEQRFSMCVVSNNPVPEYLWTRQDEDEYQELTHHPDLWERFNQARVQTWLGPRAGATHTGRSATSVSRTYTASLR